MSTRPSATFRFDEIGYANSYLTEQLLPTIQFEKFNGVLCLLDPYGLRLDWEVILHVGRSRAIDMFLNFPVIDMNRNASWRDFERVPRDGVERMTRFWGDESWKQVVYLKGSQDLFLGPEIVKQSNEG